MNLTYVFISSLSNVVNFHHSYIYIFIHRLKVTEDIMAEIITDADYADV